MSGIRMARPSEYLTSINKCFRYIQVSGIPYPSLFHIRTILFEFKVLKSWTVLVANKKLIVQHTSSLSDPDPNGLKSSSSEFADSSVSPSSSSSSSFEISKSRKRNWK